jgi:type 1 glutamine amidotransferase
MFLLVGLTLALLPFAVNSGTTPTPTAPSPQEGCMPTDTSPSLTLLVFSKTAAYRHESISAGITAIESLAAEHNWTVTATEDSAIFNDDVLAETDVVIFLNTSGDVLDEEQKAAFQRFIQNGGGFVGIHSATDTEYNWHWYGELIGAYFADHPAGIHEARVVVEDPSHPAAAPLPEVWTRRDEWYNFRENPRSRVNVILSLDESSYAGGTMQGDHPIAWSHEFDGGRVFYTGLGHTPESFSDPLYLAHLNGGIDWAGGRCETQSSETATNEANEHPQRFGGS